jgi:hypothetical protein
MALPQAGAEPRQQTSTGPPAGRDDVAADAGDMLLQFLRHRDAHCPVCRYTVRDLTQVRCPECGRGLMLTVGAAEPYLRPWVIATVPMCMWAGLGVFFLLVS